jgi:hypothetical protein
MLSDEITATADRLLEVRYAERRKRLSTEIAEIKLKYAARYMLNSSLTVMSMNAFCGQEIVIRAGIAWQVMLEVLPSPGDACSEDMLGDLDRFMRVNIDASFAEVTQILIQDIEKMMRPERVSLEEARNHAIAKYEIEIDSMRGKGDKSSVR